VLWTAGAPQVIEGLRRVEKDAGAPKNGAPAARYGAADPRIRCYQVAGTWLTETLIHPISQWGDIRKKYWLFGCELNSTG
jgi:hypothetical protein